uniref:leucine-rich repeat protein n=1 Tax=Acinetobacter baumannii TaxID=470 RepID=UPI0011784B65
QDAFQDLISLAGLLLNNNRISYLPKGIFRNLKQLQFLDIGSNRLTEIGPEAGWKGCVKLATLGFQENNINHIQNYSFLGMTSLQGLDLQYNKL